MRSMPDLRLQRNAPIRSPRRTTGPAAIADRAEFSAGAAKSLSRPGVGIDYLASDSCSGCCYYPTSSLRESANPSGRMPPPRSPGLGRGRRARLPGFGKPIRAGIPKAGKVASEARPAGSREIEPLRRSEGGPRRSRVNLRQETSACRPDRLVGSGQAASWCAKT